MRSRTLTPKTQTHRLSTHRESIEKVISRIRTSEKVSTATLMTTQVKNTVEMTVTPVLQGKSTPKRSMTTTPTLKSRLKQSTPSNS